VICLARYKKRMCGALVARGAMSMMQEEAAAVGRDLPPRPGSTRRSRPRAAGVSAYAPAINRLRLAAQDIFDREGTSRNIACAILDQVNTVLGSSGIDASAYDGHLAMQAIDGVRVAQTHQMQKAKMLVQLAVAEWIAGRNFDDCDLDTPLRVSEQIAL
jgi:hypothetical protein